MNRRPFLQLFLASLGLSRPVNPTSTDPSAPAHLDPTAATTLDAWLKLPIQPVINRLRFTDRTEAEVAACVLLWDAIHRHQSLTIRYHGGSDPGQLRAITPALVFHKLDDSPTPPLYVMAWCHLRQQHRTFRLDRIELPEMS